MSDITIRPATRADVPVFLSLVDALADHQDLDRPSPEARDRLVRDGFGEHPLFHPFLAELDGEAVAYAIAIFTYSSFLARRTLYVEDVFVLPRARRKGVARSIFRFLAGEAARSDCGRMEWSVLDWNQSAIDFYESLGAHCMGDWSTYRLTRDQVQALAEGHTL
jgi:GNAT superfamily N-acetyltransferase